MTTPSPILTDRRLLLHEPAEGPETPERLERILMDDELAKRLIEVDRVASATELARVHTDAYVRQLVALRGRVAALDAETFLSPGSVDAALRAAGVALELVDGLLDGRFRRAFAAVRPPGHHALPDAGGGYCVLNNVAVAAAHAVARGAGPVLIVDWDVHQGNGTERIFWDCPDVVLLDIHQDDCFPPRSGAASARGGGRGFGRTINVPVPPGLGDADYARILRAVVGPVAEATRPKLVLVSSGFDAHEFDPHGDERLSPAGFAVMTAILAEVADRHASGRLGLVLEGGYVLSALAKCVRACMRALDGDCASVTEAPGDVARRIAAEAASGALAALSSVGSIGESTRRG